MEVELAALAIALIAFQVGDAIACIGPIPLIKEALDRIKCPPTIQRLLPFIKLDSAIGLAVGLWVPIVGAVTIGALVLYFVVAIAFHVRARDTVVETLGAVLVMAFVIIVGALSYFPAV